MLNDEDKQRIHACFAADKMITLLNIFQRTKTSRFIIMSPSYGSGS